MPRKSHWALSDNELVDAMRKFRQELGNGSVSRVSVGTCASLKLDWTRTLEGRLRRLYKLHIEPCKEKREKLWTREAYNREELKSIKSFCYMSDSGRYRVISVKRVLCQYKKLSKEYPLIQKEVLEEMTCRTLGMTTYSSNVRKVHAAIAKNQKIKETEEKVQTKACPQKVVEPTLVAPMVIVQPAPLAITAVIDSCPMKTGPEETGKMKELKAAAEGKAPPIKSSIFAGHFPQAKAQTQACSNKVEESTLVKPKAQLAPMAISDVILISPIKRDQSRAENKEKLKTTRLKKAPPIDSSFFVGCFERGPHEIVIDKSDWNVLRGEQIVRQSRFKQEEHMEKELNEKVMPYVRRFNPHCLFNLREHRAPMRRSGCHRTFYATGRCLFFPECPTTVRIVVQDEQSLKGWVEFGTDHCTHPVLEPKKTASIDECQQGRREKMQSVLSASGLPSSSSSSLSPPGSSVDALPPLSVPCQPEGTRDSLKKELLRCFEEIASMFEDEESDEAAAEILDAVGKIKSRGSRASDLESCEMNNFGKRSSEDPTERRTKKMKMSGRSSTQGERRFGDVNLRARS